jgi:hypothetical protein
MDSDRDVDTRIAQLEHELAQLNANANTSRAKATRVAPAPAMPRRWSLAWVAVGLLAVSLPVTAVIGSRAREVEHSRELALAAKTDLEHRRLEVATTMLDAALDERKSPETRKSALRFLAGQLGSKSKLRAWARAELEAIDGSYDDAKKRKKPKKPRHCGGQP